MLCAGVGLLTSCSKLQSRDQLNQGVLAYKNGKYNDAVKHFKQAVELDPTSKNAQLYLATSYYIQWVPGAENPDNVKNHDMAAQEFNTVLAKDPNDPLALAMMASMAYNAAQAGTPDQRIKALEEARQWNLKRIEANGKESEAYYYLGVIDWAKAYGPIRDARAALKMAPTEPGPIKDEKVRADMKDKCGAPRVPWLATQLSVRTAELRVAPTKGAGYLPSGWWLATTRSVPATWAPRLPAS